MTALVWDKEAALKRVRNKPERLVKLVNIFLDSMPERFEQLRQAVEAQNFEECANIAHAIKGVSGNLGAEALHELSAQLEKASLAGDAQTLASVWPSISSGSEQLLVVLRSFLAEP